MATLLVGSQALSVAPWVQKKAVLFDFTLADIFVVVLNETVVWVFVACDLNDLKTRTFNSTEKNSSWLFKIWWSKTKSRDTFGGFCICCRHKKAQSQFFCPSCLSIRSCTDKKKTQHKHTHRPVYEAKCSGISSAYQVAFNFKSVKNGL